VFKNVKHPDRTAIKHKHLSNKLFKKTDLKVAYRTRNTIGSLLRAQVAEHDKYKKSGIYQCQCPEPEKISPTNWQVVLSTL
jgi:hypothetical protein